MTGVPTFPSEVQEEPVAVPEQPVEVPADPAPDVPEPPVADTPQEAVVEAPVEALTVEQVSIGGTADAVTLCLSLTQDQVLALHRQLLVLSPSIPR